MENEKFGGRSTYRRNKEDDGYYWPEKYNEYQENQRKYQIQQQKQMQLQQQRQIKQQQMQLEKQRQQLQQMQLEKQQMQLMQQQELQRQMKQQLQLEQKQLEQQRKLEQQRQQRSTQLQLPQLPQKVNNTNYNRSVQGYKEYPNYTMNDMEYYGYYDNNPYIVEGNDFLRNNYVENEYSYNNSGIYNPYYYKNNRNNANNGTYYNYYGANDYEFNTYNQNYNRNSLDRAYQQAYANSQYYENNYNYGNSREEFNRRHNQNRNNREPNIKIEDETYYSIDSRYLEDDEEEAIISLRDIFNLLICVGLALMIAFLIVRYVAQHTEVDGHSMNFNLKDKDVLIIDKLTYRFEEPKRFDIITFPTKDNTYYIKRIIGLPGEKVKITDKNESKDSGLAPDTIYINGKPLDENYGFSSYLKYGFELADDERNKLNENGEYELADDEYFVMGDNRNDSTDSRSIGAVKKEKIVGRAVFRLYPFDTIGSVTNTKINEKIKINNEYSLGEDGKEKVKKNEEEEYKKIKEDRAKADDNSQEDIENAKDEEIDAENNDEQNADE